MSGAEIINLENIYLFDGGTKENWDYFSKDINNESFCKKIMFQIFNYLTTQPKNELTLDIIDYIIDFGCPNIQALCANKNFLDQILNLLKPETNAGLENQKKAIFLIQKWAKKFSNDPNMKIFQEQYDMLKNNGVTFPPDSFIIDTYNRFTGDKQTNNNNNQIQKENIEQNNQNEQPPQSQQNEPEKEENNNEQEQQDEFPPTQNEQDNEFENFESNQPNSQNDNNEANNNLINGNKNENNTENI